MKTIPRPTVVRHSAIVVAGAPVDALDRIWFAGG